MNLFELLRVAFGSIRTNMLRSFLTMLGITIGIAAVSTMVNVGAGAREEIDKQMEALGSTLFMVFPGSRTRGGVRSGTGNRARLSEADAKAIKDQVADVVSSAPTIGAFAQIVVGNTNWNSYGYASNEDYFIARNWEVVEGREFTASEYNRGGKVVILGQTVAKELFGEGSAVGQTVRVRNVPMDVVGVLDNKGLSSWGMDLDDTFVVPLKTARSRLMGRSGGGGDSVDRIWVTVEEEWMMPDVQERIGELLRQRHRIKSDQNDSFSISNMSEMIETQLEARNTFDYYVSAIASVSLIVGGIGIMNIMLVSVTERTREIGLRMAVGAKASDIMRQFLVEATALCILGGIVGIVMSFFASWGVSQFLGWPIYIQWYVIIIAVIFSGAIGVFFGFYPAQQASTKDPIEALRSE